MNVIRSAGGVVWRAGSADGKGTDVEIAIVHRDRYGDWSLPKGKRDPGEHLLATAVREVREETAVTAVPSVRLPGTRYLTGVPDTEKTVEFWSMQAMTIKDFEANEEISDLRWVSVEDAHTMLTYAHDRGVVSAFAALPTVTGIAVLVRHAHAGSRKEWTGDDDHRPLDERGEQQAAALGPLLSLFKPARVCAAPLARCIDTVAPIGLPVRTDTVFAEATGATPKAVADRLRSLVADHTRVVVSSQGGVIPAALEAMRPPNASATRTFTTPKGTGWVLSFNGTDLVAADPLAL